MTDGRGKTTGYRYNALDQLQSMTDAENRTVLYQYDLEGNLAGMTDRNGAVTLYAYDSRNLLVEKKLDSTTAPGVSYTYDEIGNRTGMIDGSGVYTYHYDAENRLEEIQKNGQTDIRYIYDEIGNLSSVTDRLGFTTAYTYDRSNRMETVGYGGQTVVYTYDYNGNRESVTYSTGVREEFRYDRDNKLLKMTNSKADGSVLSTFSYTYDLAGRQLTKTDSYGTTTYSYDAEGRILREETPGRTAVYSYDTAGNRNSLNETYVSEQSTGFVDSATGEEIKYILKKSEYVYSASNRLVKLVEKLCEASGRVLLTRTTAYLYDGNGNQLRQSTSYTALSSLKARQTLRGTSYGDSEGGEIDPLVNRTSNTFDGFNRLKKTEQLQNGTRTLVEYTYNGDDLRVSKTVRKSDSGYTPEVTEYLYDRQHVILETDGEGSLKVRYVRGVNYLARTGASGGFSAILYNGHGDVVQTVDASGNIENNYDYDIWGNPTLTLEQYSLGIRYAGEFFDKETGVYYLRARYYNPYIGRFISEDSYWGEDTNPLSLNLYTYCSNDPVQFTDPTGHWQAGDEKLTTQARVEISRLTDLYYAAKTPEEKKAASIAANTIRNNSANQTSTSGGSTGAKVNSVLSNTSNKDSNGNAYMTADEWKSISQTKDDKVVVSALKDNTVTQAEINKIASTAVEKSLVTTKSYGEQPVNSKEGAGVAKDSIATTGTNNNEWYWRDDGLLQTPNGVVLVGSTDAIKKGYYWRDDGLYQTPNGVMLPPSQDELSEADAAKLKQAMKALKKEAQANELLDIAQTGLDALGMIPVVGEPIDGLNAGIYWVRGDKVNAALSAASMLPIAGWVTEGGKLVRKTVKVIAKYGEDALEGIKVAGKEVENAAETVSKVQIAVNKEIGNSFDVYVEGTKLKGVAKEGLLETQEPFAVDKNSRTVKPDYSIYSKNGDLAAIGDAKSGIIKFDDQFKGFVEVAEKQTTSKTIIYYTPTGNTLDMLSPEVRKYMEGYAGQHGVKILEIGVN
jgi:RHS repeat-associated protein